MSNDCLICFLTIETKGRYLSCVDPSCSAKICEECGKSYLNYCYENQSFPRCPNTKCRSYYLWQEVSKNIRDSSLIEKYVYTVLYELTQSKGETVKKRMEQEEILNNLRKERQVFLETSFPLAIAKTAKVVLKEKLKKLEKSKSQKISQQLSSANRYCMNLSCKGYLDQNLKCLKCQTEFCGKCERRKKEGHQCKEEDIQSLDFIRNMRHCPKCNVVIQKSEGCNNMTCVVCKTNFLYNEGTVGGSGSSNQSVVIKERGLISGIYQEKLEKMGVVNEVLKLENLEPKAQTDMSIQNLLKKHYENQNENQNENQETKLELARKLAKKMDKFYRQQTRGRIYYNIMAEVEELIQKDELTQEIIFIFIEKINNFK